MKHTRAVWVDREAGGEREKRRTGQEGTAPAMVQGMWWWGAEHNSWGGLKLTHMDSVVMVWALAGTPLLAHSPEHGSKGVHFFFVLLHTLHPVAVVACLLLLVLENLPPSDSITRSWVGIHGGCVAS